MAREARRLTKTALDALRKQAQADGKFSAYVADAGQPGLYAWARRGRVRFVFAYRQRLKIDEYGAITLDRAGRSRRSGAGSWRAVRTHSGRFERRLEPRRRWARRFTRQSRAARIPLRSSLCACWH